MGSPNLYGNISTPHPWYAPSSSKNHVFWTQMQHPHPVAFGSRCNTPHLLHFHPNATGSGCCKSRWLQYRCNTPSDLLHLDPNATPLRGCCIGRMLHGFCNCKGVLHLDGNATGEGCCIWTQMQKLPVASLMEPTVASPAPLGGPRKLPGPR